MPSKRAKQLIKALKASSNEPFPKTQTLLIKNPSFLTLNNVLISAHNPLAGINPIHNKEHIIAAAGLIHVENPGMQKDKPRVLLFGGL